MKHKRGMLFLAVVLSAAVPILANDIHPSFAEGDKAASASRSFGLSTFNDQEFQIESNSTVLITDFTEDSNSSRFVAGQSSVPGPNSHQGSLSYLGSNHDGSFGRDGGESQGGGDGTPSVLLNPVSVLPTPEPGSLTLFLIGLAGLGIIVYRHRPLKRVIQEFDRLSSVAERSGQFSLR